MKSKKIIVSLVSIAVIVVVLVLLFSNNKIDDYHHKYEGTDLSSNVEGIGREDTYTQYRLKYSDIAHAKSDIDIDIFEYKTSNDVLVADEYEGEKNVLITGNDSYVEWNVNIEKEGMYQVYVEYYPIASRGIDIERKFYINGERPFNGADTLSFTRFWTDKSEVRQDNQGNDIRPMQIEQPKWSGAYFKDSRGYETEPYLFYFDKGINQIALEAVNEPMAIKSLTLKAVDESIGYDEYLNTMPKAPTVDVAANYKMVVQGEDAVLRSDPSLYALFDRSSPATVPYSVAKIRLNMIGGEPWRVSGQWIEWDFTVPADGYYNITIKGRQNYQRGFVSNRCLYIDDVIPFDEVSSFGLKYNNEWQSLTLSDEDGNPYQFYLTEGTHSIRLEVTLGEMGPILDEIENIVFRLNDIYRKILVLTGTEPDRFRDYRIDEVYPEVIEAMELEYKRLYKVVDDVTAYTGQKADQIAAAQTLATQLEKFVDRPDKIPASLGNFKMNISALGTSILTMSEGSLDIDCVTITGVNEKPDPFKENFFTKFSHELKSFATSFRVDYTSLGDVYDDDDVVEVWILTGRDQSTILKSMIDDTFTPETGIRVNLKLVEAATLLNAVIAGTGPDVALSVGQGEPVNYALRNAVEDLTQFDDYEEVLSEFYESAYISYLFEDGLYGLPETQNFNVLYYRTDILESLEVDVPQTWDDLINIMPVIQQNNMEVAIPIQGLNNTMDLSGYFAMLYQNGGALYEEEGRYTLIDEEAGVAAFELYTKFFTQYKLPVIYDFVNRFRSGEMPLGIQDYSVFNTLSVFAPEIRGLWDFTLIPGTVQPDGTIDRSCHTWGLCSMMLKQEDEAIKANSWEFMKWWASADTQVRFGREMESVMGAAARYATANVVAFEQLSWSSRQTAVLREQREWAVGIREIAGGYYTGRHIGNAVRKVQNKNEDPRETLLDYARTINEEIEKKRLEFGLDLR